MKPLTLICKWGWDYVSGYKQKFEDLSKQWFLCLRYIISYLVLLMFITLKLMKV